MNHIERPAIGGIARDFNARASRSRRGTRRARDRAIKFRLISMKSMAPFHSYYSEHTDTLQSVLDVGPRNANVRIYAAETSAVATTKRLFTRIKYAMTRGTYVRTYVRTRGVYSARTTRLLYLHARPISKEKLFLPLSSGLSPRMRIAGSRASPRENGETEMTINGAKQR